MKTKQLPLFVMIVLLSYNHILLASPVQSKPSKYYEISISDLAKKSNKEIEKELGINFSLKEKFGLWVVKRKIKKVLKKNPNLAHKKLKEMPNLLTDSNDEKKPYEPFAIFGLSIFGLGLFLGLLGFLLPALVSLVGFCLVFGLIMLIISYRKHKKEPTRYGGRWAAEAGRGMCLFILIAIILAPVIIIALLLSANT